MKAMLVWVWIVSDPYLSDGNLMIIEHYPSLEACAQGGYGWVDQYRQWLRRSHLPDVFAPDQTRLYPRLNHNFILSTCALADFDRQPISIVWSSSP